MEQTKSAVKSMTLIGSTVSFLATSVAAAKFDVMPDSWYDDALLVVIFVIAIALAYMGRLNAGPLKNWFQSTTVRGLAIQVIVFVFAKFKITIGDVQAEAYLQQLLATAAWGSTIVGRMKQGGISGVLTATDADPVDAPLKEPKEAL